MRTGWWRTVARLGEGSGAYHLEFARVELSLDVYTLQRFGMPVTSPVSIGSSQAAAAWISFSRHIPPVLHG